ncbi:MAG: NADH-quinone oxidoreductase subunit A [Acidimicrobiia bacterium]|nr:NADH-quinone oxidoreductase subunit A [Acidimicrobiia bacterium]
MVQFLPILAMAMLVVIFVVISFKVSMLLTVKRPTRAKTAPYECGIVPENEPAERFPVRFYLVAMAFIVLDVEIIFLYPFATVFQELGGYGLALMGTFLIVLLVPFAYLLSVGALDWGPVRQVADRIIRPVLRAAGLPEGVAAPPLRAPQEEAA